jgi:cell division protein FtsN
MGTDETQTEGQEQGAEEQAGTEGLAPNDPTQSGDAAELTDEQKAALEAEGTQGDQGPQVREQDAAPVGGADATGFDPNRPVASSPPPPDAQSGVPNIPGGENAGVEPGGTTPEPTPAEGGAAPTE